jgi:hypothetical protein
MLTEKEKGQQLPRDMITRFMGTPDLALPVFERIVHVPVFGKDGDLATARGYDKKLRAIVWPNFETLPVPDVIGADHLAEAIWWINEASRDFPFSDAMNGDDPLSVKVGEPNEEGYLEPNWERGKASRANFTAALLQTFVRDIIDGPTPNYHIDKPDIGTGADFLRDVISIIINGERCPSQPFPRKNEELQKVMTATLRSGADIIPFNNIDRKVASGQLASALTAGVWRDRVLGVSEVVQIPIRCLWLMDGNNVSWSHEMLRRNVPIRIDAATKSPSRDRRPGRDFKYQLQTWLKANRPKLVWSCHVVVRNWVQQGMKRGPANMASFEDYAGVMSGIFEAAGTWTEFLANTGDYLNYKDTESSGCTEFLQKVWDTFKWREATTEDWLSTAKAGFNTIMDGVPVSADTKPEAQMLAMGHFTNTLDGKTDVLLIDSKHLQQWANEGSLSEGDRQGRQAIVPQGEGVFMVKVKMVKRATSGGRRLCLKPFEVVGPAEA